MGVKNAGKGNRTEPNGFCYFNRGIFQHLLQHQLIRRAGGGMIEDMKCDFGAVIRHGGVYINIAVSVFFEFIDYIWISLDIYPAPSKAIIVDGRVRHSKGMVRPNIDKKAVFEQASTLEERHHHYIFAELRKCDLRELLLRKRFFKFVRLMVIQQEGSSWPLFGYRGTLV